MKKLKLLPVLAAILAMASAFTFAGKTDTEYYTLDGDIFLERPSGGECIPGNQNCTYEAAVESPRLEGHPEDFNAIGEPNTVYDAQTK